MANVSVKRIYAQNQATLKWLKSVFLGVNGYFLLVRLILQANSLNFWNLLTYFIMVGISWFIYFQLVAIAQPNFSPSKELLFPGEDLSAKGLTSYMFDILYVTWFVQITTSISSKFFYVYLVVPAYIGYMALTMVILPYFLKRPSLPMTNLEQQPEQDSTTATKSTKRSSKVKKAP